MEYKAPEEWKVAQGHYPALNIITGPSFEINFWTLATDVNSAKAEQRMKDARLISSAPELLAALRGLENAANTVAHCYKQNHKDLPVVIRKMMMETEQARKAIAKTGVDHVSVYKPNW